jgi:hypothetical protein
MPFGLIAGVISKIIDALVQGGQMKKQEADAARADLNAAFSSFMQYTQGPIYALVRNAIVIMFAAALASKSWGQTLAANANAMPWQFWLIIGWEFYGSAMLNIIPWFKGSVPINGLPQPTAPPVAAPQPPAPPVDTSVAPHPAAPPVDMSVADQMRKDHPELYGPFTGHEK